MNIKTKQQFELQKNKCALVQQYLTDMQRGNIAELVVIVNKAEPKQLIFWSVSVAIPTFSPKP